MASTVVKKKRKKSRRGWYGKGGGDGSGTVTEAGIAMGGVSGIN